MGSWISWSSWRSRGFLGLDLTDDSLRLVELQQRKGALALCAADAEPLPLGCVVDGHIQQFDAVVSALAQCLQRHAIRARDVAMALPAATVRRDAWDAPPGLDDDTLAALVAEQVAQRWSAEPDDWSLDYGYVADEEGSAGQARVWVAAAPLELVQDRQGLAQACGLRLTDLESEVQASQRTWQAPAWSRSAESFSVQTATDRVQPSNGPFNGMSLGPGLVKKGWPSEPFLYATACGLALRRFAP